jgi:hypothetical protein
LIKYVKKSKQDRIFRRPDGHDLEWKRLNAPNLVMKMLTAHEELGNMQFIYNRILCIADDSVLYTKFGKLKCWNVDIAC